MTRVGVLLLAFVCYAVALDLYILDLRELTTNKEDRKQLKKLFERNNKPRMQIRQDTENIAARQSSQVQQYWNQIRQLKDQAYAAVNQERQQQANQLGLGEVYTRMLSIDADLSISSNDARKARKKLVDSLQDNVKDVYKKFDRNYDKNDLDRFKED